MRMLSATKCIRIHDQCYVMPELEILQPQTDFTFEKGVGCRGEVRESERPERLNYSCENEAAWISSTSTQSVGYFPV